MDYLNVKLSDADIKSGSYMKFLGGGKKHWESRGAFQLYFLRKMGLQPEHRLFDIGCGPLRAGVFFISFLNSGNYCGVDYNEDFIRTGREIVSKDPALQAKSPRLQRVIDFDFTGFDDHYNYVLAFSVLNHCAVPDRMRFFQQVDRLTGPDTRIFITHAHWFDPSLLAKTRLAVGRKIAGPRDIAADLNMEEWGWPSADKLYPILEIAPAASLATAAKA